MDSHAVRQRLTRRTLEWLQRESSAWIEDGILDGSARDRILARYDAESVPHRGTMALTLLAVLMCGIGVLLVIGYNWDRIPAAAKVTMVLAAVAAAFAGAAVAYARKRPVLGEVLSFSGTLLFGNGIWLIAQVLHIQGHFPDAFLWFSIGALAAAALVESTALGVGAVVLSGVWLISEATFYPRVIHPFLVLCPAAVGIAYRHRSTPMIRIIGLAVSLWVFIATVGASHMNAWPGSVALTGCALYAAGRWQSDGDELAEAWRMSGLGTLLLILLPLMVSGLHAEVRSGASVSTAVITGLAAAFALSALARPARIPADWAVAAAAFAAAVWTGIVWSGLLTRGWWLTTTSTVVFSAVALLLCVTLIRSAFRSNRTPDLVFGLLFGLAFLIVRWMSVIENLLWSGLLLLITGGGLLFIARQWLRSDRTVLAGRMS